MRLLIIVLICNLGVFSQVPTVNGWSLGMIWATNPDTGYIKTYLGENGQIFAQRGEPYFQGMQVDWVKYVVGVTTPDTLVFEMRVLDLEMATGLFFGPRFQNDTTYIGLASESIPIDGGWNRVVFDLGDVKSEMFFLQRLTIVFQIKPIALAGTVSSRVEIRKMSGIYGETEVPLDFTTNIEDEGGKKVEDFTLQQNYPNPFNPSTTIDFRLTSEAIIDLRVYNLLGQEVAVLIEKEIKSAGNYSLNFNAEGLPSGTYIYRLISGNDIVTRKMILLR